MANNAETKNNKSDDSFIFFPSAVLCYFWHISNTFFFIVAFFTNFPEPPLVIYLVIP